MPRYPSYAESTKQRIVQYVNLHPGLTGAQIAGSLGLDKSRVNSFLYSEGRRRFQLQVSNWRWRQAGVQLQQHPPNIPRDCEAPPGQNPPAERQPPVASICGSLSRMGVTEATLKIRGMTELQINLAFAEDDFSLLDSGLQAELAIRRQELLNVKPVIIESRSPVSNPFVLIALCLFVFLLFGNLMNNSSSERLPYTESPASTR